MADNVTVDNNALTDYVVASDDDGTAQHQYVKLEFGADNTQTKVTTSVGLPVAEVYTALTLGTGERAGATSVTQFATITTKWVKVKAQYDNAGRAYIGISGATKADGTTDTTTGWQLVAGDETPWFPLSNLNQLYLICDNAGDDVTYAYLV